ncbi:MAG: hypothetical protein CFH21_01095 [Alphaproteobacteria bacterium MarineAlpha5_Bin11]|nr:MAG: hypothetical protein CFH21_01095 [Alphaproteobacteria bacterium MarineAlpha5_Bin11]PPR51498.1 MAG: hypothetical protein CFH20_00564 [Alphaproteobacteria bacterium MarineAlpha5_Bin10]|tara:strand:+ start:1863 stop:2948 length:1086 start_codon:yes stop_codon:yes gene_type:complete
MFVADLHNDILQRAINGEDITVKTKYGHSDIVRLKEGNINLEVFVIWVTKKYLDQSFKRANNLIDKLEEIEKNSSLTKIVRSFKDLNTIIRSKKLGMPFGIEGGECIEENIDNLNHFIDRGLLYFGPTWNYSNAIASSAFDEVSNPKNIGYLGVSIFGKEVISLCQERGVIVDVSHIGERSFWDIINFSKNPIIASHSNVYNICPHYRNLKDDQLIAIKNKKGVVFLNLYSNFVDKDYAKRENFLTRTLEKEIFKINKEFADSEKRWIAKQYYLQKAYQSIAPSIELFIDHIDYIVKFLGIDYVGIGSDYDGMDSTPKQIQDCSDHMLIAKELEKRRYSYYDIEKIMGLNFCRVYEEVNSK